MEHAIGVDLGGTNIKAVVVSEAGEVQEQVVFPTEDDTSVAWAARIREHIRRLQSERGTAAARVGLAAPGLASPDGRRIAWMQGRLEAVQGLDWTEHRESP